MRTIETELITQPTMSTKTERETMSMNTRKMKPGGLLASIALAVAFTPQVWADPGTDYDTEVTNDATLSYDVGTAAQTDVTAGGTGGADSFYVDVMVDMTLTEQDGAAVQIAPAGTAETEWDLVNLTNGTMFFRFTAGNDTLTAHGGASDESGNPMDVSTFVLESDSDGSCADAANRSTITLSTGVVTVSESATLVLCLTATAPTNGEDDGDIAVVELIAIATDSDGDEDLQDGDNADGSGVATYTGFAGTNVDTLIVLAEDPNGTVANGTDDDTGVGGGDGNGQVKDTNAYILASADLTVTKTSAVISDPLGQATYEIPGSILEYTLVIENTGSAAAADIFLTDGIDVADVTFRDDDQYGASVDLTIQAFGTGEVVAANPGVCDGTAGATSNYEENVDGTDTDDGSDNVLWTSGNVLEILNDTNGFSIPADSCAEIKFRVTID
jgi:uncharacterized repeat protein (TIGR01451 family)